MLERFKVPKEDEVRISEESLRRSVTAVFEKMGTSPEDATAAADVLVATDLRGVETHGVSNMLRTYVKYYSEGTLNPTPQWRIERESPATATIDGDNGLGIIQGPRAMAMAVDKARNVGVGVVMMHNSGHLGAVGHHAMLAAKDDMVGVCMTTGGTAVVPTFAAEARIGTNPISIAAPANREPYVLFDAATSSIAGNKIRLAERLGAAMLPGWIADNDGSPIMEESPVPPRGDYRQLPLGGSREQGSHKGYGFSLLDEVLGGLLAGRTPSMLTPDEGPIRFGHHFAAYNIEAFTDLDSFKSTMDRMLQTLRDTPPAPGHERVLYPGLSEHEAEVDRRANGIPLHKEVVEWFDSISAELSVPSIQRV